MLKRFEKRIAEFVRSQRIFKPADKVLLAVSGGADSTALLYAMCALRKEGHLPAGMVCAHINHQLRAAQADGDERFVVGQCEKLGLEVATQRVDVNDFARRQGLSIETAARKLRYDCLLEIADNKACRCVATAHQKDDNAETIIQRLARGTGFRGLGGIWPVRTRPRGRSGEIRIARPLLCAGRAEIERYLQELGIKWRRDRTNEDVSYRRNFIRHRLLPELQNACSGDIAEELNELSDAARRFYTLVCRAADKLWRQSSRRSGEEVAFDCGKFSAQPKPVRVELIRRAIGLLGGGEGALTAEHFEKVMKLAENTGSGRRIELPGGFLAQREYEKLVFKTKFVPRTGSNRNEQTVIKVPGRSKFGNYVVDAGIAEFSKEKFADFKNHKASRIEWFDFDKLRLPLTIRHRRAGDKFWPLSIAGEKRIGKFLSAQKVRRRAREKILVIEDAEKIIWVWPVRMSEQAKLDKSTKKVVRLEIIESSVD